MFYLNPGLTFDRAAIFRSAWRAARERQNWARNLHFYAGEPAPKNVRAYFAAALRDVWAAARAERADYAQTTPEQREARSALASALFGATMIDSTRRSFAAQDAIRDRFAMAA